MAIHRGLFFLLLILLPTQLGLHMWPEWSTVLGRRIDYLSPTVYGTDILIGCVIVSWFWEKRHILYSQGARIRSSLPGSAILIVGVIVGIAVCNISFALSPPVAIYGWLKALEFAILGFYIVQTRVSGAFVLPPLAIAALYSSLLAIMQYMNQGSVGGVMRLLGERTFSIDTPGIARFGGCFPFTDHCFFVLRPYATFPHPNVLAGFLGTVLLMLVYAFFYQTRLIRRHALWFTFVGVCSLATLFLTLSRSAWVFVVAGYAVVGLLRSTERIKQINGTGILLACLISLSLLVGAYIYRPSIADSTVSERRTLNSAAVVIWRTSPIVGIGMGNFIAAVPSVIRNRDTAFLQPVHNIYLLVLSQVGIVGLLLFIGGLFHVFLSIGTALKNPKHYGSRRIYLAPLVLMLLIGFVDHYTITLQQGQILATLLVAGILTPVDVSA